MKHWKALGLTTLALLASLVVARWLPHGNRTAGGHEQGSVLITASPRVTASGTTTQGSGAPAALNATSRLSTTSASSLPTGPAIPSHAAVAHADDNSPASGPDGHRRRPWDANWLQKWANAQTPVEAEFELLDGKMARGTIHRVEEDAGQVNFVAGKLIEPESGSFFFRKQAAPGVAGPFVGVVQLSASETAYRLEPGANADTSDLVEHRLEEVACLRMPQPPADIAEGDDRTASAPDAEEAPIVDPNKHPSVQTPDYQNGVIVLESLPGAKGVIYLDFDGENTSQWDGTLIKALPSGSTSAQIREVWRYVAEDYLPFNLNVTTDLAVFQRASETSRIRCIITPTADAAPTAGGVAFVGSFNWSGDTPCWVFMTSGKACAEAASHEVGHTLGLSHDGRTTGEEYYAGHGSGEVSWAPIMGVGYNKNVTQWSKGEYANASNKEDDLAIISTQNNNVTYRTDDFGSTYAAAAQLEVQTNGSFLNSGVIERNTDADAFKFTTAGGSLTATCKPAVGSPNLAIQLDLIDTANKVLLSVSPATTMAASLSTNLPQGAYALKVRGAARGASATVGFTTYASLGYYELSGTLVGGIAPQRFTIAENPTNGAAIGPITPPGDGEFTWQIVGGTGSAALTVDTNGMLSIADRSLFDFEKREQVDLFLNITSDTDPTLNQTNRRVVVKITDANESPTIQSNRFTIFRGTKPSTVLGAVTASDPETYARLKYFVTGGDGYTLFTANDSGAVLLKSALPADGPAEYLLDVTVSDGGSPVQKATNNVLVKVLPQIGNLQAGSILYARYLDIAGTTVASLTNNARFPDSPSDQTSLPSAETPQKVEDNFGGVMRGYVLPPVTGSYVFYVAGDDNCELLLSTNDLPGGRRRIAYHTSATDPRQWTKFSTQKSASIALETGKAYYIEARFKEGSGGDHLEVGWQNTAAGFATTQVIPGRYLAPYTQNYPPTMENQTFAVRRDAFQNARTSRIVASDLNTNDVLSFEIVSADPAGILSVDKTTGWLRVADAQLLQQTDAASVSMSVRVTDPGGRAATAQIDCALLAPADIFATAPCQEVFSSLGTSTLVSALSNSSRFPGRPDTLRPLTEFNISQNIAEGYGSRVRALIYPPVTGSYVFYIASDDTSELWLAANSTNPATAKVVARVTSATSYESWTTQTSQRSSSVVLTADVPTYIEARHKEGTGSDHLEVAWVAPGEFSPSVIPLTSANVFDIGERPQVIETSFDVPIASTNGTTLGKVVANDSALDALAFRIASGDDQGLFSIDIDTGTVTLVDGANFRAGTNSQWSLVVEVQDSGYSGLYPRKRSSATVTINRTGALQTPVELWAQQQGLESFDPAADPDNDGLSNLQEFAFGGRPLVADSPVAQPRIAILTTDTGAFATITFRRRVDAGSVGLAYVVERSENLDTPTWAETQVELQGAPVTVPTEETGGAPVEEVTFRVILPVDASSTSFFRIRAVVNLAP